MKSEDTGAVTALAVRRVGIDTYRENVAYLHRRCPLYLSEGFQALAKIEVAANGRSILASLNIVDDPGIVAEHELGLSEEAFAQLGAEAGTPVRVDHAPRARVDLGVAAQGRRRAAQPCRLSRGDQRHRAAPLQQDRTRGLRRVDRPLRPRPRGSAVPDRSDDRGRPPARLAREAGRRQAQHRRHPGESHVDADRADRRRARDADPQDLVPRDHVAGRDGRHDGVPGRRRTAVRAAGGDRARAARLPRVGRLGRPVARRRRADLRRAPAVARLAGPDGGLDPVEEDRRGVHAPRPRHSARPDGQGALDAGGAAAEEALRVRGRAAAPDARRRHHGRPPAGRLRNRARAGSARRDARAARRSAGAHGSAAEGPAARGPRPRVRPRRARRRGIRPRARHPRLRPRAGEDGGDHRCAGPAAVRPRSTRAGVEDVRSHGRPRRRRDRHRQPAAEPACATVRRAEGARRRRRPVQEDGRRGQPRRSAVSRSRGVRLRPRVRAASGRPTTAATPSASPANTPREFSEF